MKRTVRLAILGAMLQGSAHAGEPNASAKPSLDKGQGKSTVVKQEAVPGKKNKIARKKAKSAEPVDVVKTEPAASPVEKPAETTEQTVQLKGVRG